MNQNYRANGFSFGTFQMISVASVLFISCKLNAFLMNCIHYFMKFDAKKEIPFGRANDDGGGVGGSQTNVILFLNCV